MAVRLLLFTQYAHLLLTTVIRFTKNTELCILKADVGFHPFGDQQGLELLFHFRS